MINALMNLSPRYFIIVFVSVMIAWFIYEKYEKRQSYERPFFKKYLPGKTNLIILIPLLILILILFALEGEDFFIGRILVILLYICVYYIMLLMLLPLFRRWMHARVVALLWMLPFTLLYILRYIDNDVQPFIYITLPRTLTYILLGIEILGFVVVMSWKTIEHFRFRNHVLQDAKIIKDPQILDIWQKAIHRTNFDINTDNLVYSSNVNTPLSIGMFRNSTYIILPKRFYSEEELTLIFAHELTHITKRDVATKIFITFCMALCWFNPFMWIALNKCMEDLELSCDEEILLEADEKTRKLYAKLILDTVGDSRGFSSCLSANAKALHYRLSNVMKKRERRSGAFLIAIIIFFMCISCGQISFALSDESEMNQIIKTATTGAEIIFNNEDISTYKLVGVYETGFYERDFECIDENAFHTFLSDLKLEREIFAVDGFDDEEDLCSYRIRGEKRTINIAISKDLLRVSEGYTNDNKHYYRIVDSVDLDYLNKIVRITPTLSIRAKEYNGVYRMYDTRLLSYILVENGQKTVLKEVKEAPFGLVGIFDCPTEEIRLDFSSNKIIDYYIEVTSLDDDEQYIIKKEDIKDSIIIVNDKTSNYRVHVTYDGPYDSIYKAVYQFDISSR